MAGTPSKLLLKVMYCVLFSCQMAPVSRFRKVSSVTAKTDWSIPAEGPAHAVARECGLPVDCGLSLDVA